MMIFGLRMFGLSSHKMVYQHSKVPSLMFSKRKEVIQMWNDIRVNK